MHECVYPFRSLRCFPQLSELRGLKRKLSKGVQHDPVGQCTPLPATGTGGLGLPIGNNSGRICNWKHQLTHWYIKREQVNYRCTDLPRHRAAALDPVPLL